MTSQLVRALKDYVLKTKIKMNICFNFKNCANQLQVDKINIKYNRILFTLFGTNDSVIHYCNRNIIIWKTAKIQIQMLGFI